MVSPESVLDGLDPDQRAAAVAVRGPVCILAGAGTGKTRAITHRIAYAVLSGTVPESQVMAVTFTTRAAGEMRSRLRRLGVPRAQARTFHAAALRQLQYFWPRAVGGPAPQLVESKIALVAEAARRCGRQLGRPELRDVAAEIEWAKVTQVRPDGYVAEAAKTGRQPPLAGPEVSRLYAEYEKLRRERNLLDFESILELTVAMVAEHRDVATEVRDRYRYFVVDEYQDVNPLQKLLLDAWLGDRGDVCVVGDPNQTIYSFTGASPSHLLRFPVERPDATIVRLTRDYRSTPQVVRTANAVIGQAGGADGDPRRALELVAQRPSGPEPSLHEYDDEVAEAEGVARRAGELMRAGVAPSEIAVLFRINAQSQAYEQAFAEADVPYVVRGVERFFERPEIRRAVVLLRGSASSYDAGVQDEPSAAGEGTGLETGVRHVLSGAGLAAEAPAGSGSARERHESLMALVRLARSLSAGDPSMTMAGFVAELETRAATQHAPPVEGVTLASLHAAKGLEWDAVFLVGLAEGTMPIVYAQTHEQVEEERRLLYVGATRAREHLTLSWALARSPGARRGRAPSRFLDALRPADTAPRGGGDRAARGGKRSSGAGPAPCRVCGRKLTAPVERKLRRCETCPSDLDEELLARLREWRLAISREQKIPAFVVFTDATLTAIAETRPGTERELLAVPGVGATKLERYGQDVLALCGDSASATDGHAGS